MHFNSSCKMQCSERHDIPKANVWRPAERLGLARTALLTVSTFSGVCTEWGRPRGFLFMTDPVVLNASTHRSIVFRSGRTVSWCSTLNFRGKRCWTATTESLFLKKLRDGKHTMLYVPVRHSYWNCTVWAVRRLMPNVINPTLAEY